MSGINNIFVNVEFCGKTYCCECKETDTFGTISDKLCEEIGLKPHRYSLLSISNNECERDEKICESCVTIDDVLKLEESQLYRDFTYVDEKFPSEYRKIDFDTFYDKVYGRKEHRYDEWSAFNSIFNTIVGHGELSDVLFVLDKFGDLIDIDDGNEPNLTPLMTAASVGKLEIAKFLLDSGAYINNRCIYNGMTALDTAAYAGHLEMVKLLFKHGAIINWEEFDYTPLIIATEEGHEEIVEFLLESGANINDRGILKVYDNPKDPENSSYREERYQGETALEIANRKGFIRIVELISKYN